MEFCEGRLDVLIVGRQMKELGALVHRECCTFFCNGTNTDTKKKLVTKWIMNPNLNEHDNQNCGPLL